MQLLNPCGIFLLATVAFLGVDAASLQQGPEETRHFRRLEAIETLRERGLDVTAIPRVLDLSKRNADGSTNATGNTGCIEACTTLCSLYGTDQVIEPGTAEYQNFTNSYWSAIASDAKPACIFLPQDPIAVSSLVLVARLTQCKFAPKSGGHAAFAGASSIDGGITMSFEKMNAVVPADDRTTVWIQPGNVWGDVYKRLGAFNLTVVGGRVYPIGVGGLTLGGGISFFSNLYGWACDNVASYQVVLANGQLVTASPDENPQLYSALRGGGFNFGIVTAFNFFAYPLVNEEIWGGTRYFAEENIPAAVDAFTEVTNNIEQDLNAGTWLSLIQFGGLKISGGERWYAKPNGNESSIWKPYTDIPTIGDAGMNRKLSEYALEIEGGQPDGFREVYYVIVFKSDPTLNQLAKDQYFENIGSLVDVKNSSSALVFQSITVPQMRQMSKNGGNAIMLDPIDGPYVLACLSAQWGNAADDATVYTYASNVLEGIKNEAESKGLNRDYLYMNYASQYQDVIASYGIKQKSKLVQTAQQYDPDRVFQTLTPGYFKLDHAPVPGTSFFSF